MKAYYDNIPAVIEKVGNGSYLYRWNIQDAVSENSEGEKKVQYVCEEVTVWPPLTANSVTEAVITETYASNYEQKLINDYNAVSLGVMEDEEGTVVARYKEFLSTRAKLKAGVDKDFKNCY